MTGPSAWLLAAAAARLRGDRPGAGADWAQAMTAEAALCGTERDRLGWAFGCWIASLRPGPQPGGLAYTAALAAGLAAMAAWEWCADEGRATIIVLGALALCLGALRPGRALLSGAATGLVVAGVIAFEAASGIHPAYETRAQTLHGALHWLILLAPAWAASLAGAWIGRRLRASRVAPPPPRAG